MALQTGPGNLYDTAAPSRVQCEGSRVAMDDHRSRDCASGAVDTTFDLVERAKTGDSDALNHLFARYLPSLRRWASGRLPRWTRDLMDTDDLVQETVVRAVKRINRFESRHEGALQAYLRQAVVNRIRDEVRRARRSPTPDALDDDAAASRDDQAVVRQLRVLSSLAGLHRSIAADLNVAAPPPRPAASPAIGSWAHLKLIERLGGGAFGDVYRAWDADLERDVALKLLRTDAASENINASRIANEGRLLARVRHANVVCVHGVAVHDERVGLWMELLRGATLEQQLAAHGSFSAREAMLVGIDLCGALAAIHAAGLIHRDVKAQNVMREEGGRIVLMDLGTGREADGRGLRAIPELAGTPLYLAPEIFLGAPASARTDLYSLGVLLYHLVTGAFPVRATTIDQLQARHADGAGVRLRDARADLPAGFVRVIDRAIAGDPSARYETAGAFEAALVETLGEASVPPVSANT